jgi:hypothetical protein
MEREGRLIVGIVLRFIKTEIGVGYHANAAKAKAFYPASSREA